MSYRRPIRLGVLTLFVLGLAATQAAAWGPAVHAYVADHSGRRWPSLNRAEIYGATLPDMCYFASEPSGFPEMCAAVIHGGEGFPAPYDDQFAQHLLMWEDAPTWRTKALGFGYMSHALADHTAHEAGVLIGRKDGYVIRKATLVAAVLRPQLAGLGMSTEQIEEAAHNLVEAATDILAARVDANIGNKLSSAAVLRGAFVPERLVTVYGPELEPLYPGALTEAEEQYRLFMSAYGQALAQDETTTITVLAEQFADIAYQRWGVEPPVTLVVNALRVAMLLCADFPLELSATTFAVRMKLWEEGIIY